MVDGEEGEGLDELRLDRRGANHHQRLLGEHGRALGDGVDVAGEAEVLQIRKKFLGEHIAAAEVLNILVGEVQVLDVVDELLQTGCNGEAAAVGHLAEEYIEVGDAVLAAGFKVAVAHGQLVEVAEHGHVQLFLCFHSYTSNRSLRGAQSVVRVLYRFFSPKASLDVFLRSRGEKREKADRRRLFDAGAVQRCDAVRGRYVDMHKNIFSLPQ